MHHSIIRALPGGRALFLLTALLLSWQQAVANDKHLTLQIDGQPYRVDLFPQSFHNAMDKAHAQQLRGEHYRGELPAAPDSWARLSLINGQWQGMVALDGEVHIIEPAQTLAQRSSLDGSAQPLARAISSLEHAGTCGVDHHHEASTSSLLTTRSSDSPLTLPSSEDFDSALCQERVDGICLMPKIAMVFDHLFQQHFADDYQDQAAALMNIIDGYYRNDMRMTFHTLHMAFPQEELFTDSTDSGVLLNSVRDNYHNLDFLDTSSERPLLHLVSGRSFDGSTVGLAWVSTLCNPNGYATGVTQIYSNIPLTALVLAHEIGHNFSGSHDQDNGCGGGFIMSSFVNSSATNFSSCSQEEMLTRTLNEANRDNCFDYPVDAGIQPRVSNPAAFDDSTGNQLELVFDINYQQASRGADNLIVNGELTSQIGRILRVSLDGGSCTLGSAGADYHCEISNPSGNSTLFLDVAATGEGSVALSHSIAVSGGQVIDIVGSNNTLSSTLPIELESAQPDDLSASGSENPATIMLRWTDRAATETGYQLERQQAEQGWQLLAALPANSEHYKDNDIQLDTLYHYRVSAQAISGDHSNIISHRVESTPAAPSQLTASREGSQVLLSWQNNAELAIANKLERQRLQSNGSWGDWLILVDDLSADSSHYIDQTVVLDNQYRYRVSALNISVSSAPSNPAVINLLSIPLAPVNLQAKLANSSIQLSWRNLASNAASLELLRQVDDGPWLPLAQLDSSNSSYTDQDISLGSQYRYRISASNDAGQSPRVTSNPVALSEPEPESAPEPTPADDSDSNGGGNRAKAESSFTGGGSLGWLTMLMLLLPLSLRRHKQEHNHDR